MTTANLTIQDNDAVIQYVASAAQTVFPYDFPLLEQAEIAVSVDQVDQVLGSDFTVDGVGDAGGGNVTFASAMAGGEVVTIWLNMPIKRLTGFSAGASTLLPTDLNTEFVRQVRHDQMLRRDIGRALRLAPDDPNTGQDMELPTSTSRAGRFLAFDANGRPVASEGSGGGDESLRSDLADSTFGSGLGANLVAYPVTADEQAAGVTVVNPSYPELWVDRYGANTVPGTTDMTAAIQAACDVAKEAGGGIVEFAHATYLLSTLGLHSVVVPVAGTNFADDTQNIGYHILLDNASNVHWRGRGTLLLSDETSGGTAMLVMDGPRNFRMRGIKMQAQHTHDSSGTPIVHSCAAVAITSQDRHAYNIDLDDLEIEDCYVGLYVFGTDTRTYSVRGISANRLHHTNGIYTIACHMNGDGLVAKNVVSSDVAREYFIYGVSDHDVSTFRDVQLAGFQWIIKAYHVRDTTNIKFKPRVLNPSSSSNGAMQTQHATAVQAVPNRLINIELDLDNTDTAGIPVEFNYLAGSDGQTVTATSANNLFTGIVLKGILDQVPTTTVAQNGAAAAYGTLNTDGVVLLNGALDGLYYETGFLDSKQVRTTFVPVLKINDSATGITYAARVAEYYRDGQFIEMLIDITLSSKGASNGAVTIDLPVTSSVIAIGPMPGVNILGFSDLASLSGPIVAYMQSAGDAMVLLQQGAAGVTNLTDAELTNDSRIILQARYPVT